MTREELEMDRAQFKELYDKSIADANAIKGAIQYIDRKIAALDVLESAPNTPTPDAPLEIVGPVKE